MRQNQHNKQGTLIFFLFATDQLQDVSTDSWIMLKIVQLWNHQKYSLYLKICIISLIAICPCYCVLTFPPQMYQQIICNIYREPKYYASHIFRDFKANLKQKATCSQHAHHMTFSFNLLFVSSVLTLE